MELTIRIAVSVVGFSIVVAFCLLTRFQHSVACFTGQLGELVKELQRSRS